MDKAKRKVGVEKIKEKVTLLLWWCLWFIKNVD